MFWSGTKYYTRVPPSRATIPEFFDVFFEAYRQSPSPLALTIAHPAIGLPLIVMVGHKRSWRVFDTVTHHTSQLV